MTNYDYSIDVNKEALLLKGEHFCHHISWNFCGAVWYDKEHKMFHSAINRYHRHVCTISAPTLKQLMEDSNEQYGND